MAECTGKIRLAYFAFSWVGILSVMFPWLTLSKGENVDVIKAEHIDRQKRSMDDHKRLDAVAAESWSALCNCRSQLERKLGIAI